MECLEELGPTEAPIIGVYEEEDMGRGKSTTLEKRERELVKREEREGRRKREEGNIEMKI